MKRFLETLFWQSTYCIISLTAIAKIATYFSGGMILYQYEPLTQLPYRQFYLYAVIVEILTLFLCYSWRTDSTKYAVLFCFVFLCAGYHVTTFVLAIPIPCPCLGEAQKWIPLILGDQSHFIHLTLVYFSLGLAVFWRNTPVVTESQFV